MMAGDGVLTQVIDPASDRAVYKQIADHLRDAIARSRLHEGEQLPSEARLMEHAGLAHGTPSPAPNPGPGAIYARLEEQRHTLARFTEDVTARMPTPEEAKVPSLRPGVPVFRLVRTAYDVDGRAVEVCDTVMAAD